jgi:hypothetical protein
MSNSFASYAKLFMPNFVVGRPFERSIEKAALKNTHFLLKGQLHEIFDLWFFSPINPT